jgi:NADPH:quinone reductase-like Zn-dependent oxidoreductase
MRAVRLSAPGPVDNLRLTTLPLPPERDGWVRIRVEAFGLNRSELKLRLGLNAGVSFPRVPGIEAVGTFDAADLPREAFQEILDAVAAGRLAFPVDRVYGDLEQVPQAHDDMEHDRASGKLVVRVRH